jgi:futalosine hydrolase
MNVLIIAATEFEIAPLLAHFDHFTNNDGGDLMIGGNSFEAYITGVGSPATTYGLTKWLNSPDYTRLFDAGDTSIITTWNSETRHKYDLIIQAGVAGAYGRDLELGEVVFVTEDQFGDVGAEDHERYLDIFEMGLIDGNQFPYSALKLINPLNPAHEKIQLPRVSGLTVNTVSGNERTIQLRKEKYGCQIESMEGAAFHYVCLQEHVAFAQVRAISNYVIPRDKSQWKMKEAIINLNNWLMDFVKVISVPHL